MPLLLERTVRYHIALLDENNKVVMWDSKNFHSFQIAALYAEGKAFQDWMHKTDYGKWAIVRKTEETRLINIVGESKEAIK